MTFYTLKISKKTIQRLKKYLAETVLATLGYAWICFSYGSFAMLCLAGEWASGFFLIGSFSFILCLLGCIAYKNSETYKGDQDEKN